MDTTETKKESEKIVEKHDKKELSMRYLAALIQYADWIPEEYKKLVTRNSSVDLLQQIYLCACDKVPVEKMKASKNESDTVKVLAELRYECIQKSVIEEYGEKLNELRKRLASAENKIMEQEHKINNVPNFGTKSSEVPSKTRKKDAEVNGVQPIDCKRTKIFKRRESPKEFLSEIIDLYSTQQLHFIMDCMEEGIPIRNIRTFISPVLPVEIMQRLKKIEQEKGGTMKWNRIEK